MKIIDSYLDPANPGALAGISGFLKNNKKQLKCFSKPTVKNELLKSNVYTQHISPNKKFIRRQVIIPHIDHTWQADLVDFQKIKYVNSHYNYLLTVIDCFSKKAWAEPIKFKRATDTYNAFKKIIEESGRSPINLHVDGGLEFKGSCKQYLESLNINIYITESKMKASIVERFNRTIKEKMWRLFTANKNKKYVNFLDDLMSNYNNSYHRSIKNSPNSINKSNEKATFNNLYGFDFDKGSNEIITFQFNIGDYIRLVINKNLFAKGYTINWSDEVFLILKRQATSPPTYKIISLSGVVLTKTFYEIFYTFHLFF